MRQWRLAMCATFMLAGVASAGVRGGHFEGSVRYNFPSTPYPITADFAQTGRSFLERLNGDEFPGVYTEVDLGFLSFWNVYYSNDPGVVGSGICFFGVVSTYYIDIAPFSISYSGFVVRTGPAQIP